MPPLLAGLLVTFLLAAAIALADVDQLAAQPRADSITVSRRAHDAAQAVIGAALTLGLDKIGAPAWLSCTLGPLTWPTVRFLTKRLQWNVREWPWSVGLRDWAWESLLGSVAVPLVLGAGDMRVGIGLGIGWVGLTFVVDKMKWGSP